MPLKDLKTDLKSLKYSKDRPFEGYSGQPYNEKPIDQDPSTFAGSEDFLLRGGLSAPATAAEDVKRLAQYFTDTKSPSGALFVIKQNLLSKSSVKTQASKGAGYGGGALGGLLTQQKGPINQGVYTPLSTLAQAGVGFTGTHLNNLGLDPSSPMTRNGKELYNTGRGINLYNSSVEVGENNRLTKLTQGFAFKTEIETNDFTLNPNIGTGVGKEILSYQGGPGSILGFGKTIVRVNSHPIGEQGTLSPLQYQSLNRANESQVFSGNTPVWNYSQLATLGVSTLTPTPKGYSKYTFSDSKQRIQPQQRDFRVPLLDPSKVATSTVIGISPSYNPSNKRTIEGESTSRINISSPGTPGDIISYTKGKVNKDGKRNIVDRINFLPIYKSDHVRASKEDGINDLVKFRIASVLRNGETIYTHFRAFINSFNDSYGSSWDSIKYMGRGENFYKYGGFNRSISLSYTVAAQSRPELMSQYKKLNFIASTLAPDYGDTGLMGGTLHKLTLGAWCYELPGFISKFSLDIPQDSPWEIAINDTVSEGAGSGDSTVKEMPHIVNVSMDFTPIHTFRPELQKNDYNSKTGEVEKYGPQQYLGLQNGAVNNYKDAPSLSEAETITTLEEPLGEGDDFSVEEINYSPTN